MRRAGRSSRAPYPPATPPSSSGACRSTYKGQCHKTRPPTITPPTAVIVMPHIHPTTYRHTVFILFTKPLAVITVRCLVSTVTGCRLVQGSGWCTRNTWLTLVIPDIWSFPAPAIPSVDLDVLSRRKWPCCNVCKNNSSRPAKPASTVNNSAQQCGPRCGTCPYNGPSR